MLQKITCPIFSKNLSAPNTSAVILPSGRVTYRELNDFVTQFQNHFIHSGIKKGKRVAIQSENSLEYIITLFALWRIGAVAVLLSPRSPESEIKQRLTELKCSLKIDSAWWLVPGSWRKLTRHQEPTTRDLSSFNLTASATIMFTSGSSGIPKAVVHSIANHYFNAKGSNQNIPVKQGDHWLLTLPLYHVSGLSILWRCFLGGAAVNLQSNQGNFTHISLVPTQLYRLLNDQRKIRSLKKSKFVLLGGAPIPNDLLILAKNHRINLFLTYGLTEMGSQVATSQRNPYAKVKTLKYREIKIKNNEILVRGQTLFKGYLSKGRLSRPFDKQGWFKTGDLGTYNKGEGLKILGRKDNMFISGGENIYPEEIENHILATKLVNSAIVIARQHSEYGFRPIAFIKGSPGLIPRLKKELAKTLPKFKIPDGIYPFPKDYRPAGIKPNRKWLKERFSHKI